MKAAFIRRRGGATEIEVGELPVPQPAKAEVLVAVTAVAVNAVDTYIRSGRYHTELRFPFVIGRDLVGTVASVGSAVSGWSVGDRVWANTCGFDGRQGPTAEYACVEAKRLHRLPDRVDPVEAVATLHPAGTAFTGLVHHGGGIRPGDGVVVGGGAGNVGTCVVHMAASRGAKVIATARGQDDENWCRRWGASDVIDYSGPDLTDRLRALLPEGAAQYWETSGQHDLDRAMALTRERGFVLVMAGPETRPELPIGRLYMRDLRIVGFAITNATERELDEIAIELERMLKSDHIPVRIASVHSLEQAAEAHRLVEGTAERKPAAGRVVIRVGD
ncbi:MAG: zinc-binding dehydrogenase [Solirubrobacterales bacterium]|nr:zinc-binding dehydrogenase [Solirubrobacterales bacterium]